MSFEQVVAHRKHLWKLPLIERKEIPGLPKNRADVILTGVLIYEMVMEEFGFLQLRVSTRRADHAHSARWNLQEVQEFPSVVGADDESARDCPLPV